MKVTKTAKRITAVLTMTAVRSANHFYERKSHAVRITGHVFPRSLQADSWKKAKRQDALV